MVYSKIHDSDFLEDFSETVKSLIILFSMCLQGKKVIFDMFVKKKKTILVSFHELVAFKCWWACPSSILGCPGCIGECGETPVWKKKVLPLLSWSKPRNSMKTAKALQFEFPLAAAEQVASVNGCGHPPC